MMLVWARPWYGVELCVCVDIGYRLEEQSLLLPETMDELLRGAANQAWRGYLGQSLCLAFVRVRKGPHGLPPCCLPNSQRVSGGVGRRLSTVTLSGSGCAGAYGSLRLKCQSDLVGLQV